jgi:2-C-methyl-D-erythritol 4-phosphate cytidylyltransferase/2-C-methyl-D-erythritol 2,4-cyclodiphosphate synthase
VAGSAGPQNRRAGSAGRQTSSDGEDEPKQFRSVLGRPLIAWSYDILRAARCDPVVVVVPSGLTDAARRALGSDAVLVEGGTTRSQSVLNGLELVETGSVIVHDAVRPVISVTLVEDILAALQGADGAVAAVPLDETIKRVTGSDVLETVDRRDLWRAQTPQAFRTSMLIGAHELALRDRLEATDDAQVVERCGGRIRIVVGERSNIRVTWPSDFELVEALLGERG